MVGVSPGVYELVPLIVYLTRCFYAECAGGLRHLLRTKTHDVSLGLRYGEAKRRAHDHDHPHYLPQLLGGLRDDPGIVSVKHVLRWRRQDRLSGSCFPPPPPALSLFLRSTKASMMSLSTSKRV